LMGGPGHDRNDGRAVAFLSLGVKGVANAVATAEENESAPLTTPIEGNSIDRGKCAGRCRRCPPPRVSGNFIIGDQTRRIGRRNLTWSNPLHWKCTINQITNNQQEQLEALWRKNAQFVHHSIPNDVGVMRADFRRRIARTATVLRLVHERALIAIGHSFVSTNDLATTGTRYTRLPSTLGDESRAKAFPNVLFQKLISGPPTAREMRRSSHRNTSGCLRSP